MTIHQITAGHNPRPLRRQCAHAIQLLTLISIIGILASLFLGSIGDHDHTYHFPPPSPDATTSLAHLAGEYYEGDGPGRNFYLKILADGRYSFFWSGCTGIHGRESGFARLTSANHLILSPLDPTDLTTQR